MDDIEPDWDESVSEDEPIDDADDDLASDEEMENGTRLSGECYDLSGRRLARPCENSINIVSGKKMITQGMKR